MPKTPPPVIERFRITCDVEPEQLGNAVAQLTKMGLQNIHFDLVTETVTFNRRTQYEVNGTDFLRAWIADHATFAAKDAVAHFEANGRTNAAAYYALKKLIEDKVLKKLDGSNYARSDVKAISAPKAEKKAKPKTIERERHAVDHREFILNYMRQHNGKAVRARLLTYFDLHGRKSSSVGGALNVLMQRKLIRSAGEGEYQLTAKARPETAKETTKAEPPPKTNGNGAHVAEGVING